MKLVTTALVLVGLMTGCAFERHYSITPEKNQVIKVESGDRWSFDLDENATTGYLWVANCSDPDVEVIVEHHASRLSLTGAPGYAHVVIRIHRGYDGPSDVHFRYQRNWEKTPAKSFTISLFKRTGDEAFWK